MVALNERKLPAKGDAPVTPGLPKTIEDALEDFRKSFDAGGKPDYKTTQAVLDVFDDAPPRLAAFDKPPDKHADPCAIPPDSAYRGRENQLYRVEVHRGGLPTGKPDGPTFKWSRENGAVTFKVLMVEPSTAAGGGAVDKRTMVTVESLGHDRRTGLCVGDWIELIDFPREFERAAKPLLQIEKIDQQRRRLTLIGAPGDIDTGHPVLARRWDHTPDDDKEGTCLINESNDDTGWIELERGVFIRFAPGGLYDTGQYWLIPARVATGRVEWPEVDGAPASLAPHGVLHHRATLGIAKKSSGAWDFDGTATGYSHEPFAGL